MSPPPSLHKPLPSLPFDLITEILCRLPVKLLLQLKCVCKSWKSLISDPKFAKKHIRISTACHGHHHLIIDSINTSRELLLWGSTISTVPQLQQLMLPETTPFYYGYSGCVVSCCDGILLFDVFDICSRPRPPLLWNPSIRKFKILPPFLNPSSRGKVFYTFGYDHFINNYKIFALSTYGVIDVNQWKNEVSVYTLGCDYWRRIDDFPCDGLIYEEGIFVSETVNWLAFHASGSSLPVLVSLDLKKESYRKHVLTQLLTPDRSTLGVLMNCLCIFTNSDEFLDIWVMKEYGTKESWTKLFSVPYVGGDPSSIGYSKVVCVYEDDLVLLDRQKRKLIVYNSRSGTFKVPKIQNINCWMPYVYVESLISPCSYVT